ncbi:MAG TPA: RNB domain-containing ribonuclease, partial [Myxococcota bacterium]
MPVPVPRERVVEFFKKQAGRPQKAKDVGRFLGLGADDRSSVRDALRTLADEGVLAALDGKRYVLAGASNAHRGVVQRKASGSAWFIPDDKKVGDAFLPPHELLGVVDGDKVLVEISKERRGPAGKVIRVLERRRTTLTGVFRDTGKSKYVEADDNVLSGPIIIPAGVEGNASAAKDGEVVEVLLVEAPTAVTTAVGRIVRSLGKRGKLDVEIERILAEKAIVRAFPPEVTANAEAFGDVPQESDTVGREDVRGVALVTIDGETAKDFDDAVFAEWNNKKGDVHVVVAIADVAHYVTQGTALDVEALRRGTSIYYPGKVLPMLPEALSNGLCSLKPDVERLCMIVDFQVRADGSVHQQRFANGVMKSHARLTYTIAQKFFDGDADVAHAMTPAVRASLQALDEASQRLRANRQKRGALDFDLPETVIALDANGEPTGINALERLNAHKLIEDLMVAANEAVAEEFEGRKWPCVYRIHEPPDPEKLLRWKKLAT